MSYFVIGWKMITKRVGHGKTKIYHWILDGEFPAPHQLGLRKIGWIESEIEEWERSRPVVVWAPIKEELKIPQTGPVVSSALKKEELETPQTQPLVSWAPEKEELETTHIKNDVTHIER